MVAAKLLLNPNAIYMANKKWNNSRDISRQRSYKHRSIPGYWVLKLCIQGICFSQQQKIEQQREMQGKQTFCLSNMNMCSGKVFVSFLWNLLSDLVFDTFQRFWVGFLLNFIFSHSFFYIVCSGRFISSKQTKP